MRQYTDNQVRIIGGRHRGRRLPVPREAGLRPSGDRVRETVFNWLQPIVAGARCLDLFAGSGALGLEAASREADFVVMVDRSSTVVRQLRSNVELLGLPEVQVIQADLPDWLMQRPAARPFDIAFLDPPFDSQLMGPCCEYLQGRRWLRPGAWVYLEADKTRGLPPLPKAWRLVREKSAGRVVYGLARCASGP